MTKRMSWIGAGAGAWVLAACASGGASGGPTQRAAPAASVAPPASTAPMQPAMPGWSFGTARGYRTKLDSTQRTSGRASGHITAVAESLTTFGNLMQVIRADEFVGKRVRYEANVRTRLPNVGGGIGRMPGRGGAPRRAQAAIWMRVDLADGGMLLENMSGGMGTAEPPRCEPTRSGGGAPCPSAAERPRGPSPIVGENSWMRYGIELDVPANAVAISFGLMLSGRGEAWIDDVALTAIGPVVGDMTPRMPPQPPSPEQLQRQIARLAQVPTQPVAPDFEM